MKIEIKNEIYDEIKKRVEETEEFSSVEEYIAFVLEEILKDEDGDSPEEAYSKEDEEKIKERLKGLGYL